MDLDESTENFETSNDAAADISEENRSLNNSDLEDTPDNVLRKLENAWLNEKFAPEILPHKSEAVDDMLQMLEHMEGNLQNLRKDDMRYSIHKMEINRIRFIISSYLRKRLDKIEEFTIHILSEEAKRSPDEAYLTQAESQYARKYLNNMEMLFRTMALQHMPVNFSDFQVNDLIVTPNLNAHVFLKANKNIAGIVVPGTLDEEVDFETGSQHIIQYSAVRDLVISGSVQLI